jgi:hypothetical protein
MYSHRKSQFCIQKRAELERAKKEEQETAQ